MKKRELIAGLILLACLYQRCEQPEEFFTDISNQEYQTKKVVVLVIDGPRLSETWAHPKKALIPFQANILAKEGTFFSNFFNDGPTYTLPGHSAITTGYHNQIKNNGSELPAYPSMFQRFLNHYQYSPDSTLIVTSKSKLHALTDTSNPTWRYSYTPDEDTEDRADSVTLVKAKALRKKATT